MSGPVVHFNIGVCAYRLGSWSRAAAAFRETARTPQMAPLAHYNLGLVALAEGRREEATRWFARVERESGDERLQSLATAQLANLPRPPPRNWVAYGSFAAGYDDNVALVSGPEVLGVSGTDDTFAEVQLAATAPLTGPWRFDGGIVLLDYFDLDAFDQLSVNAGARYRARFAQWNGEAALQLAYATLDADGFESTQSLMLQATRALSDEWRLRARYRFSLVDGLNDFAGLDGNRHEIALRGAWLRGRWDLALEYRFYSADYDDDALSFDRHQLSIDVRRALDVNWTVQAGLARDQSRYDLSANGTEDRTEVALTVSRNLSAVWRAVVRYAYADNQAGVREFDYRRNRITAGVEAAW